MLCALGFEMCFNFFLKKGELPGKKKSRFGGITHIDVR